jgi:hypothetical protein
MTKSLSYPKSHLSIIFCTYPIILTNELILKVFGEKL